MFKDKLENRNWDRCLIVVLRFNKIDKTYVEGKDVFKKQNKF